MSAPSQGDGPFRTLYLWAFSGSLTAPRGSGWELGKSGEEACGLTSERSYRMYGSQAPFSVYWTVPIVEEAWNRQVESTAHRIEMSRPLTSEHAQSAREPSSHGSKDGSPAWPNGMGSLSPKPV